MAQGGVFKLQLGDERFDRHFTATAYLKARLEAAEAARAAAGKAPREVPSYADLEETHRLLVAESYRPHVAVASEYTRVRPTGDGASHLGAGGGSCHFVLPTQGSFTSDLVVHVRIRLPGGTEAAPLLRYCAYPGAKLFRRVAFHSAETLLDEYGPDEVVAHGKFFVGREGRAAWDRCLGQQATREAVGVAGGRSVAVAYGDGAQTPKPEQPELELLVPLLFWFCRGPAAALFNSEAPASQRVVSLELAALEELVGAYRPAADDPGRLERVPLPFARAALEVSLYANGLYVNPEVHDLCARRSAFSLARVHRRQVSALPAAEGSVLLDRLKFPTEYFLAGVRARALARDLDNWWLMGAAPREGGGPGAFRLPVFEWDAGVGAPLLAAREAGERSVLEPGAAALGFTAHGGVELFPEMPADFYGSYLPLRYGGSGGLKAPSDPGALLVPFCLHPGAAAPSGYFNLSVGRELHAVYRLARPEEYAAGGSELVVLASALNFIVRKDDRLSLRFSV
jgi:hypothetical protein